ncbi:MAG: hypothetical protein JWQ90_3383 [Hydrocarboniphaga sp.]|nr:hypothetical protein [Hydrocarboniphaga sp.]
MLGFAALTPTYSVRADRLSLSATGLPTDHGYFLCCALYSSSLALLRVELLIASTALRAIASVRRTASSVIDKLSSTSLRMIAARYCAIADLLPSLAASCTSVLKPRPDAHFHWHMRGPHFRDYHLLPNEQAD